VVTRAKQARPAALSSRLLPAGRVVFGMVVGLIGTLALTPFARFDFDFGALEDSSLASYRLDKQVNLLLGYSQTPVVFLTEIC
jgi:hypothetical protein